MIENHNISTEPERGAFVPLLIYGGLVATGLLLSQFAFTSRVRKQIFKRDGGRCVVCGSTEHLQAAHIDHNRDNPNYNNPKNGRMLCIADHLLDHIDRAGRNGLLPHQNDWAISMLKRQLNPDE